MEIGKINKAITTLEEALVIDPINNIIRTTLANLYYENKAYQKSKKAYETILKQEPNFGLSYFNYGLLLHEMGNTKKAIVQLEKGAELMPENDRIIYNLALLYFNTKNTSKAIISLKKQLVRSSNNTDLIYLLGYIYHQNKQPNLAKKQAEKLVQLEPNNQQYLQFYNTIN